MVKGIWKRVRRIILLRLKNEIGEFKYDNLKSDKWLIHFWSFSRKLQSHRVAYSGGFNFEDLIYKQTLIP